MGKAGCTSRRRKRTASLAVSLRTMAEKIVANASTYQPPMGMRLKNDRQKMPASTQVPVECRAFQARGPSSRAGVRKEVRVSSRMNR